MRKENVEVMANILYAVETGGQVYGGRCYDDFTPAYKNSSAEHAITIGAGAWYATEAKRLLKMIRDKYPDTFKKLDTAGISQDLDSADWSRYSWTRLLQRQSASRRLSLLLMESSARMP